MVPRATRIPCPVCHRPSGATELRWKQEFTICRCSACGCLFTDPLPTEGELETFYQGFLYKKPTPGEVSRGVRARRKELTERFALGPTSANGARFLDHGGGTGSAFAAGRELGMEAFFSELDLQAVSFVRETFGLDDGHYVSALSDFPERFDYIFSDNVIEHAIDPAALLRDLVSALAPGGTLVVKTPNAAASEHFFYPLTLRDYLRTALRHNRRGEVLRMVLKRPIWYCDPPRHLYSFTAEGLLSMVRRIGLTEDRARVTYYGTPAFANTITRLILRRPKGLRSALARALALPAVPFELASKPLQRLAVRTGAVSAGGLLLFVDKPAR